MKLDLAHPGTQYSHRVACELNRIGALNRFFTGIGFTPSDPLLSYMPASVRKKISNRIINCDFDTDKLHRIAVPEIYALIRSKVSGHSERILFDRNRSFQERLLKKFGSTSTGLIGFDTSSWLLGKAMNDRNLPFVLDQSIGHPRSKFGTYDLLRQQYPMWTEAIPLKKHEYVEIETVEHQLATTIVVASSFTKQTLIANGVDAAKIILNPYGVGQEFFRDKKKRAKGEKTRLLYLGALSARKGLPFLLDVWNAGRFFEKFELWIAGPGSEASVREIKNHDGVFYKGKVPFKEVPSLISECEYLIFPSFFEGFGQVILEAMAAGLPVITTEATAGPDIIEHNVDGFLFRAGDAKALHKILENVADPSLAFEMGSKAREKAKAFSWTAYGARWKSIIDSLN